MSMFSLMDLAAGVGVPCLVGADRCQDDTTGNVRGTSILGVTPHVSLKTARSVATVDRPIDGQTTCQD